MLPALAADAAGHIGGVGAVLEVIPTGCRQGGLERCRPFPVGLGETPDLIGRQAEVAQYRPERLACVDRIEELLPNLVW